jgi:7tm Odorant receptor
MSMYIIFTSFIVTFLGMIVMLAIKFMVVNSDVRRSLVTFDSKELSQAIDRHNQAIELVSKFNESFSLGLLVNFAAVSMVLCMTLFTIINSEKTSDIFMFGSIILMIMNQVAVLCHYENQLEISSLEIAETVYESKWYESTDKGQLASLKLILIRAQKPCQVKTWKFKPYNYEILMTILSAAFSYQALLASLK